MIGVGVVGPTMLIVIFPLLPTPTTMSLGVWALTGDFAVKTNENIKNNDIIEVEEMSLLYMDILLVCY